MAITSASLTQFSDAANGTSYATSSISPSADKLILVNVAAAAENSGGNVIPTLSGNGLTWVQIATTTSEGTYLRNTLFRAMGASPSSGALTADFGVDNQSGCMIDVHEFSGIDTSGANGSGAIVQSVTNTNGAASSLTVTLAAFGDAGNATYGCFHRARDGTQEGQTEGSGFTELTDQWLNWVATFNQGQHVIFRDDNDTTVDSSTSTSYTISGIAVEIKAAAVGVIIPVFINHYKNQGMQ